MSGIAGIVRLDGAPVVRADISGLCAAIAFRGPDAQCVWNQGPVGFAHTLLRTTFESAEEQQPATLDGRIWITADARIDGRPDLIREMGLPQAALSRPDCELILRAYARWGESCMDHLLGDFSFAIWDASARKLFCARDHFGVKPFYYAHIGNTLIFSNTLNCIRVRAEVSDELNELAILDFLIFGCNQDAKTTTFSHVLRLQAAHNLVATGKEVTTRRYWSLPEGECPRYRRVGDYVEEFRTLLETATADRLRTNKVAIMMSGGLDSPSIAVAARKASPQTEFRAHTLVYDWLIPDDERHFSGLVAKRLEIPVQYLAVDHIRPFERSSEVSSSELQDLSLAEIDSHYYDQLAAETRVSLTGYGADPLLCPSPLLNWSSVRAIPLATTVVSFLRYTAEMRAIPKFRLRSTVSNLLGRPTEDRIEIPAWLDANFARRTGASDRKREQAGSVRKGDVRPLARSSLRSLFWPNYFEFLETGLSSKKLESYHPYFDLRLVKYLLAVPDLPYSMDKYLLREAMRGLLPESVRTRAKTPVQGDALWEAFRKYGLSDPIELHPRLCEFVQPSTIPRPGHVKTAAQLHAAIKPISLNLWLTSQEKLCPSQKTTTFPISDYPTPDLNCVSMATSPN